MLVSIAHLKCASNKTSFLSNVMDANRSFVQSMQDQMIINANYQATTIVYMLLSVQYAMEESKLRLLMILTLHGMLMPAVVSASLSLSNNKE